MKRWLKIDRSPHWTTIEIARHVNFYSIHRDHGIESGFFRVNVPEAGQRGFGFQLRIARHHVIGMSIYGGKS